MARGADGPDRRRFSRPAARGVADLDEGTSEVLFGANPKTGRIERFVTVANVETADHGATILAGNQKVLAARLSDAKFFWENDLRTVREKGLEGMAEGLRDVTFHNKLGSQADRVERIAALAREIAPLVGAKPDLAAEAARVAKADLQSEMVGEFPELQGLMGRYYAQAAGHDDGVPEACEEHYKPLGPGDAVPKRAGLGRRGAGRQDRHADGVLGD